MLKNRNKNKSDVITILSNNGWILFDNKIISSDPDFELSLNFDEWMGL